jgi:hypothetical protein
MRVYVLGAGASYHAGYPLASSMGSELFLWMKEQGNAEGFESRYPGTAQFFEERFGPIGNVEDLFTEIQRLITEGEHGTPDQRAIRSVVANEQGILVNALRSWFIEIRQEGNAEAYKRFATEIVAPGDFIITFNYDVSLERELKRSGKFEIGDGYGFRIEPLPMKSATKILKLHGSTSWLALMFGGITSGPFHFEPGNVLGHRPVVGKNELSFLGYSDLSDPAFPKGGGALPVMILPTRSKEFFFAANTGIEYFNFWNTIWDQAAVALHAADQVLICGYSMPAADERARKLLLNAVRKDAGIIVASGGDTEKIVRELRESGYPKAKAAEDVLFERWVENSTRNAAGAA